MYFKESIRGLRGLVGEWMTSLDSSATGFAFIFIDHE